MSFKFGFEVAAGTEAGRSGTCEQVDVDQRPPPEAVSANGADDNCATNEMELSAINFQRGIDFISRIDLHYETVPLGNIEPLRKAPSNIASRLGEGDFAPLAKESTTKSLIRSENSDIIEGVYEGGLKVWECSIDLCKYLAEQISQFRNRGCVSDEPNSELAWNDCQGALSSNGSVLELGCGHGLPGCLMYREALLARKRSKGGLGGEGTTVLFSDYNEFVLRDATLPNLFLNMAEVITAKEIEELSRSEQISGVSMVSGDWMKLSSQMKQGHTRKRAHLLPNIYVPFGGRFDLILAAETTYTYESTKDTAILLARHLKHETGIGLIATKRYYFGVGGGADAFREIAANEALIEKETKWDSVDGTNRRLLVDTIREYDSGSGNIRELLRVRLTKST